MPVRSTTSGTDWVERVYCGKENVNWLAGQFPVTIV
jgi:hypothetical protein